MLDLYESFETEEERDLTLALESADIAVDKAILAYESCSRLEELNLREAEVQTMMEDGGVVELMNYYEDAAEETKEKKDGILKTIWKKLKDFIDSLMNWFKGKGFRTSESMEVDETDVQKGKKLLEFKQKFGNVLANPKAKAGAIIAAIVALLGIFAMKKSGKTVKVKGAVVDKWKGAIDSITNNSKKAAENSENQKEDKEGLMSKLAGHIKSMLGAFKTWFSGLFNKSEKDDGKLKTGKTDENFVPTPYQSSQAKKLVTYIEKNTSDPNNLSSMPITELGRLTNEYAKEHGLSPKDKSYVIRIAKEQLRRETGTTFFKKNDDGSTSTFESADLSPKAQFLRKLIIVLESTDDFDDDYDDFDESVDIDDDLVELLTSL